ncbi:MAG: DNA alkylation repair protein [Desulfocapsaceae bacterium]|nr:DNA alkylation repair protein [Desulfocapsaceae bacterium]
MSHTVQKITKILMSLGNREIAEHSQRFFKTGKGEYGEGDKFLGIRVPVVRKEVKKHLHISLKEAEKLLQSEFHEIRLFAVILLTEKFHRADEKEQYRIYSLYLANTLKVNNWDLVDASADKIIGPYLFEKDRSKLYELARSQNMWERRIAIMATFYYIRREQFEDTVKIADILLGDKEDLIHKAVGWMLREMGKKSITRLENFLAKNYRAMPRIMLRYAIEKLPKKQRDMYLRGEIEVQQ